MVNKMAKDIIVILIMLFISINNSLRVVSIIKSSFINYYLRQSVDGKFDFISLFVDILYTLPELSINIILVVMLCKDLEVQ